MTMREYATGVVIGGVIGGGFQGASALWNGRNFWTGGLKPNPNIAPVTVPKIQGPDVPEVELIELPLSKVKPLPEGANKYGQLIDGDDVRIGGDFIDDGLKGNIITSGKSHGVEKHWNEMLKYADELAGSGNTVYLNKSINTALGKNISGVGNLRPDVIGVSKNGMINIMEVISPSQTYQQIFNKVSTMSNALQKAGYNVSTKIISPSY